MNNKEFAERLRELRKKAGLTQSGLAETIKLSIKTIQRWEQNERQPRMDEIKKLAQALNVTDDELLNGKQETGTWQLRIEVANDLNRRLLM